MNGKSTAMVSAQQVDDLLRQTLNVSDVHSAEQIAAALLRRYGGAATRMRQEAEGFSISGIEEPGAPAAAAPGQARGESPGERELSRVGANLQTDFERIVTHPGNRDFQPEVIGWRDTLLDELAQTVGTARFAQDPLKRDRTFLGVRRMSEYARLARLVGVMNLPLSCDYRRLATTLDDTCNVLRILMGEALYEAGLGDGGQILPVPLSDMRARRDALLLAARRLNGGAQDEDDWGAGLHSFQEMIDGLDNDVSGAPELHIYLREEMLGPLLDRLVAYAARTDAVALRQLASTSMVELVQMRKLLVVSQGVLAKSPSAALSSYTQSLAIFLDVFKDRRASARLVDLAVPLTMAARFTAEGFDGEARAVLRGLVGARAEFAQETEGFLSCCGGEHDDLKVQIQLDKVLYDIDRTIDLMSQGDGTPWGRNELRAGAYAAIVKGFVDRHRTNNQLEGARQALERIVTQLDTIKGVSDNLRVQVREQQLREERDWRALVPVLAPHCSGRADLLDAGAELVGWTASTGYPPPPEAGIGAPFPDARVTGARIAQTLVEQTWEGFLDNSHKAVKAIKVALAVPNEAEFVRSMQLPQIKEPLEELSVDPMTPVDLREQIEEVLSAIADRSIARDMAQGIVDALTEQVRAITPSKVQS